MSLQRYRNLGIALGAAMGAVTVGVLTSSRFDSLHAPGPMNTGHDELECDSCHVAAPGTTRQQLQGLAAYYLGRRSTKNLVGFQKVDNDECLTCHERPNERHPVHRFLEPRFAEIRASIQADRCSTCHKEHVGRRVTLTDGTYCRHCHAKTKLRNDPLDVPHEALIAGNEWSSCLGCHDFHGNHVLKPSVDLKSRWSPEELDVYFAGGASPYPVGPTFRARKPGSSHVP